MQPFSHTGFSVVPFLYSTRSIQDTLQKVLGTLFVEVTYYP